jgi:cell division protein FtsQ
MRRGLLVVFALLIVAVAGAVYLLRIEEIRVVGAQSLAARAIVDASALEPGQRLLWERLSAAERRIEKIPAVADAVAERSFPATVVIRVRERLPIARLDGAPHLVVDAEGFVFAGGARAVKPVLHGWKARARPGVTVDEASRRVLEAYPNFPPLLRVWGRRITVGDVLTVTLLGGTEIRFGLLRDLEAKARVAEAIMHTERGHPLAYVDVRSPTVPVSKRRGPPSPSPAATSAPATPSTTASP